MYFAALHGLYQPSRHVFVVTTQVVAEHFLLSSFTFLWRSLLKLVEFIDSLASLLVAEAKNIRLLYHR